MRVWQLALKEILYRKLNFAVGLLSIAMAAACLVAVLTLLRGHDAQSRALLAQMNRETQEIVGAMDQDVRKAMSVLGYNIVILPKNQNLGDYFAEDYAAETMPETYADRLEKAELQTLERFLPCLRRKIVWPERQSSVIILGRAPDDAETPLEDGTQTFALPDVPRGYLTLGHEIHRSLGLEPGDSARLMGKDFTIDKCLREHGSLNDDTVWMNLGEAQEILGMEGRINEILAMERPRAWADLAKVEEEIAGVLPDVQAIEKASLAATKRHARTKMAEERQATLQREEEKQTLLREKRLRFGAGLAATACLISGVWVTCLSFGAARDRREEIGVFRSLGFRSGQILLLFLSRSAAMGLAGGLLGYLLGGAVGSRLGAAAENGDLFAPWTVDWGHLGAALFVAVILTGAASFAPSWMASRRDPAAILREE